MTQSISFFVQGDPAAQPRARACTRFAKGGRRVIGVRNPPTADGWKTLILLEAKKHRPSTPFDGPVRVDIVFNFRRPQAHFNGVLLRNNAPLYHITKPDRDNLEKAVLDVLTKAEYWRDDCQVCAGQVSKFYADRADFVGASIKVEAVFL